MKRFCEFWENAITGWRPGALWVYEFKVSLLALPTVKKVQFLEYEQDSKIADIT